MRTTVAFALLLVLTGCHGKRSPGLQPAPGEEVKAEVSVEDSGLPGKSVTAVTESPWTRKRFSAVHGDEVLPDFPTEAIDARVPSATVAVDFLIGTDGIARKIEAKVTDQVPMAGLFEDACRLAVARWRFSPSWKLRENPGPEQSHFILFETRARLVFHFDLEVVSRGGKVGATFERY